MVIGYLMHELEGLIHWIGEIKEGTQSRNGPFEESGVVQDVCDVAHSIRRAVNEGFHGRLNCCFFQFRLFLLSYLHVFTPGRN